MTNIWKYHLLIRKKISNLARKSNSINSTSLNIKSWKRRKGDSNRNLERSPDTMKRVTRWLLAQFISLGIKGDLYVSHVKFLGKIWDIHLKNFSNLYYQSRTRRQLAVIFVYLALVDMLPYLSAVLYILRMLSLHFILALLLTNTDLLILPFWPLMVSRMKTGSASCFLLEAE